MFFCSFCQQLTNSVVTIEWFHRRRLITLTCIFGIFLLMASLSVGVSQLVFFCVIVFLFISWIRFWDCRLRTQFCPTVRLMFISVFVQKKFIYLIANTCLDFWRALWLLVICRTQKLLLKFENRQPNYWEQKQTFGI